MRTELIARVESATEADREIDALLWLQFTQGATRRATVIKSTKALWRDYTIDETRDGGGKLITVPEYTGSLDAALDLLERVLPGALYRLEKQSAISRGGPFWATAGLPGEQEEAYGATAPLALILAILRALPLQQDPPQ